LKGSQGRQRSSQAINIGEGLFSIQVAVEKKGGRREGGPVWEPI